MADSVPNGTPAADVDVEMKEEVAPEVRDNRRDLSIQPLMAT